MRPLREVLRLRFEDKLSAYAIAKRLELAPGVVRGYLKRAGDAGLDWPLPAHIDNDGQLELRLFPHQPNGSTTIWTPERDEILNSLFDEGLPTREIGRRMGLTKNTIIGRLHRSGMSRRRPKFVPQRNFFESSGPGCVWPHGHPGDAQFHFCGSHPLPGKPYCAVHAAIAYERPSDTPPAAVDEWLGGRRGPSTPPSWKVVALL